MVSDAYFVERTAWIDGPLKAARGTLQTNYGLNIPLPTWNTCPASDALPLVHAGHYGNRVVINDGNLINPIGLATPYPATVTIDYNCLIERVSVVFNGLTHAYPSDILAVLEHEGVYVGLMLSVGGGSPGADNAYIVFNDSAPTIPDWPSTPGLGCGTYAPSRNTYCGTGCAPPGINYGDIKSDLSAFHHLDSRGDWNLYVADNYPADNGYLDNGFSVNVHCHKRRPHHR
jgi:hypothetical protein